MSKEFSKEILEETDNWLNKVMEEEESLMMTIAYGFVPILKKMVRHHLLKHEEKYHKNNGEQEQNNIVSTGELAKTESVIIRFFDRDMNILWHEEVLHKSKIIALWNYLRGRHSAGNNNGE